MTLQQEHAEREKLSVAKSLLLHAKLKGLAWRQNVIPRRFASQARASFAQERLWFLDRMEQGSAYISYLWLRLKGALDASSLERALGEVVRRHEVLRTHFAEVDGAPVQVITPFAGLALPVEDRRATDADQLQREISEEVTRPFALETGPLLRARLLRVAEQEHVLLISMHHIVTDGWSLGVLEREMSVLYEAYRKGESSPLPELAVQYADYAVWQREQLAGEALDRGLSYWKTQLAGAPALVELPLDHPRAAVQTYRGAQQVLQLPADLLERLQRLGRREGATLFMVLLSAWQVLLSKYSGSDDVVVGTPIAGRNRREIEDLIGFFVNMLVLRTDLSGDPSFRQLLGRVREVALGGYEHQEVPFEKLVAELQPERSLSHSPLFQVAFQLQEDDKPAPTLAGLESQGTGSAQTTTAKFDLQLDCVVSGQSLAAVLIYSTDLFERATIERMLGHLRRVLEQVASDAEVRLSELELMEAEERQQLLYEWNDTAAEYPRERCIHELFEDQVSKTPDAAAVVHNGQSLSYQELNRQANQLAHYLRELGVRPDTRVGICLKRSVPMMVAVLAVLKAGAAYVPLDPEYPLERLRFMLEDSHPLAVLTQAGLPGMLQEAKADLRFLHVDTPSWGSQPETNPEPASVGLTPNHLAYVIYTSGSTGTPKGVMVEHRNTVNFIVWARQAFAGHLKHTLFSTSLNFDLAVYESLAPLSVGGRVEIVGNLLEMGPAARAVGLINTVPSALQALIEGGGIPPSVNVVNLAGEPLKRALVERVFSRSEVQRVCNLYGPSEATTYSTWMAVERGEAPVSHIGKPIANTSIYLLNAAGRAVPVNVSGELYVGGAGLARGYLHRPALTAERFVPDPFAQQPGARMYRTGDVGRYREEGNIEFVGRNDSQIKLRGFRIELGEIEARLMEQPTVREAVVILREDVAGEKRLVAYVVGEGEATELRAHLKESLPDYMVPAAFVSLDHLPLTPNGKLDRKALPAPQYGRAELALDAPQNPTELQLTLIWEEILGVQPVSPTQDFFDLGGHSLLAVHLLAEIKRKLGFDLMLATLFSDATIRRMANEILARQEAEPKDTGVVALQPLGNLPPLFCVHPAGREVYAYVSLARHLGSEQPVFGIPDRGTDLSRPLPEIAAEHVAAIRAKQPNGPYFLLGWSFGGKLVYEMAALLENQKQKVAFVGVLDTVEPGTRGDLSDVADAELVTGVATDVAEIMHKPFTLSPEDIAELSYEEQIQFAMDLLRKHKAAPPNYDARALRESCEAIRARVISQNGYEPGCFSGQVTLFRAADARISKDLDAWMQSWPEEERRTLGWSRRVADRLEMHWVPGTHSTLCSEPNVRVLGERLRASLHAAREGRKG